MPAIMTGTWEGENCMKVRLLASASAAAFILLSGTALAQTASSQAVQDSDAPASSDAQTRSGAGTGANDIIVTATRRNERLQDVPLSITAFSQADLTEKGIAGYEGLAQRSEEHTSELPSLMRISYAVLCLKKKQNKMKQ